MGQESSTSCTMHKSSVLDSQAPVTVISTPRTTEPASFVRPNYKNCVVGEGTVQRSVFRVPRHFEFERTVASGVFGNAAAFTNTQTGATVAVKKIAGIFNDELQAKRVLREVKLLRQLKHKNIVRLLDICPPETAEFDDLYMVTDLMEIDLHKVIQSKQRLTEEHHKFFTHQILQATAYLHSVDVVHRDLKPQSILVNKNCDVKLCDFGLARILIAQPGKSTALTENVATRWYRAPEIVLLSSQYTKAIDVWAIGCIFCELVNRRPLLAGGDDLDQVKKAVAVLGMPVAEELRWLPDGAGLRFLLRSCSGTAKADWCAILPSASVAAREFAAAALRFDPDARASAQEASRLPFFAELNDDAKTGSKARCDPIDWSFDKAELSRARLRMQVLSECAIFHAEVKDMLPACHHAHARAHAGYHARVRFI